MCETAMAKHSEILTASAVGSCLVITLYHPGRHIGAMAHAMLPNDCSSVVSREPVLRDSIATEGGPSNESPHAKYVDKAIDEMLRDLENQGAKAGDLEAKIVGGANMFPAAGSDIGRENVLSARQKLKEEGIKLVAESVGGHMGRSVDFSAASGIVTVKIKL